MTDPLARAFLQNRIDAFKPRIKKMKKTKTGGYVWELQELANDMRRTLKEFEERIRSI